MIRAYATTVLCTLLVSISASAAPVEVPVPVPVAPPPNASAPEATEVLYRDTNGFSSISVTQILPNSSQSILTFSGVERVALRQEVFIITWAQGAITLLPKQFVSTITINRRASHPPAPATTLPATQPAPPPP